MKIFNVNVYGEKESVIASGYPFRVSLPNDKSHLADVTEKRENVAKKLSRAKIGSGHDNWLKGIVVQFDIQYPQYFTPQFQRYHFADIVSSMSKMHCLTKFDIEDLCNSYVSPLVKNNLKKLVEIYNFMNEKDYESVVIRYDKNLKIRDYTHSIESFTSDYDTSYIKVINSKYELYMMIISDCPMGLEMVMRVTTNLQQLKTMYEQRRHHKLKDDWGVFCDWLESLDVFKKYVLNEVD